MGKQNGIIIEVYVYVYVHVYRRMSRREALSSFGNAGVEWVNGMGRSSRGQWGGGAISRGYAWGVGGTNSNRGSHGPK